MWREFFLFDMNLLRRQPAVIASCAALCALMLATAWLPPSLVQAFGASTLAAPVNLALLLVMTGIPASFLLAGPVTHSVIRDSQANTLCILLAMPMRTVDYLIGKTMAAVVTATVVCGTATLTLVMVACVRSPEVAFIQVLAECLVFFGLLVVPNMLVLVTLVIALAYRTRSVSSVYGGVFLFYIFWAVSAFPVLPVDDSTRAWISALTDPFGGRALATAIDGIPKALLNTSWMPNSSAVAMLVANRVLWLTVAASAFAWVIYRSKPLSGREKAPVSNTKKTFAGKTHPARFTGPLIARQLLSIVRFELHFVLRSVAFRILLGGSVILAVASLFDMQGMYGSFGLLTTSAVLSVLQDTVPLMQAFVALAVTGELMHKAADARVTDIEASFPVARAVRWTGVLGTALLALTSFTLIVDGIALLIQLMVGPAGSSHMAPWQMLLAMQLVQGFVVIALAIACDKLFRDRLVGYIAFLVIVVGGRILGHLVTEAAPWQYGSLPRASYSDLTGFGNNLAAWWHVAVSWCLMAAALVALVFVVSGRKAMGRTGTTMSVRMGACALVMAGAYYSAVAQNTQAASLSASYVEALHAKYEQRYSAYRGQPQLRVRAVDTTVELYPETHSATIQGTYTLVNTSKQPIDRVQLSFNPMAPSRVTLPGTRVLLRDEAVGFEVLQLPVQVQPEAQLKLTFEVRVGEGNGDSVTAMTTEFNNHDYFPQIGYLDRVELTDTQMRQKYGLPPRPDRAEPMRITENALEGSADWISLHAVITTRSGDVALTAGDLVRTTTTGGRTSFEYQTRAPILPYFGVVSGPYAKRTVKVDNTQLQVYYSPLHAGNLDRLVDAATKSMRFYQKQLGAYPHSTLSLVEVPGALQGAQSYPGLITFFEGSEFNRSSPTGALDPLLMLAAHEIGHQWWGNQLIGAKAPGSEVLTESMAQFGALLVVRATAGVQAYDKALMYEKQYYQAVRRTALPALLQVMPEDRAQTYHQGALVLSTMSKDLGPAKWDAFLATFFNEHRLATAGYPTARNFLDELCGTASKAACSRATMLMTTRSPNL